MNSYCCCKECGALVDVAERGLVDYCDECDPQAPAVRIISEEGVEAVELPGIGDE
jgi:hypothetical protein